MESQLILICSDDLIRMLFGRSDVQAQGGEKHTRSVMFSHNIMGEVLTDLEDIQGKSDSTEVLVTDLPV